MALSGLSHQEEAMIRKMVEGISKIDFRSLEEKIKEILEKLKDEGKITGFLPKARYQNFRGFLAITVGRTKYNVIPIRIIDREQTEEELEKELIDSLQQI